MVAKKLPSQREYHAPQSSHPSYRRFDPLPPRGELTEKSREIIANLRVLMREFQTKKPDRKWAQRVLDRHAAGEHIFPLGLQYAREVAGMPPEREPGSDDE